MPLLLIPEYSGINKGQRIPDTRPWNSPGQNTGAESHSLLQVIFLYIHTNKWSSGGISGKESACNARDAEDMDLIPGLEAPREEEMVTCQEAFNKRLPVCWFGSVRNPLALTDS